MEALEKCEREANPENVASAWQRLASLGISYVLFNLLTITAIVSSLNEKVQANFLQKRRLEQVLAHLILFWCKKLFKARAYSTICVQV